MHPRFHAKPYNVGTLFTSQMHTHDSRNCHVSVRRDPRARSPPRPAEDRAPPVALDSPRRAVTGGATATCVQCGLPPAARGPPPPLLFPCRDNDTARQGRVPRRRAVGASVRPPEPSSQMPLALPMPVSLAGRDPPVEIPPSPDAPSVAHQRAWHALGGSGAAVLQPSTTARARSPTLQSAAPHAFLMLLISSSLADELLLMLRRPSRAAHATTVTRARFE